MGADETVFLDQWWEVYDLSTEPDGVRELRDGTCILLTSDGDAFVHVEGDEEVLGPLPWTGEDGKYTVHGEYDVDLRVEILRHSPAIWSVKVSYLTLSVDALAKDCDRLNDTGDSQMVCYTPLIQQEVLACFGRSFFSL